MEEVKDFPDVMVCSSADCGGVGNFRYTWPGRDEAWVCLLCVQKLQAVAAAIGIHVQFIPLTVDDYLNKGQIHEAE